MERLYEPTPRKIDLTSSHDIHYVKPFKEFYEGFTRSSTKRFHKCFQWERCKKVIHEWLARKNYPSASDEGFPWATESFQKRRAQKAKREKKNMYQALIRDYCLNQKDKCACLESAQIWQLKCVCVCIVYGPGYQPLSHYLTIYFFQYN
mgnify:FL=1